MAASPYRPPFTLTDEITSLAIEIGAKVAEFNVAAGMTMSPTLRRENRLRTIQSSLAIEANSLTLDQVTALANGKRVIGPASDILEVTNALAAYDRLLDFDPTSESDLLKAHKLLMTNLVNNAGRYRQGGVGVFAGGVVKHMAPPAKRVPQLMSDLLAWVSSAATPTLIKSCVFHYEFEFIHPFEDGNGRFGRLWHTVLLANYNELFAYLPIETLIAARQEYYYKAIEASTSAGECSAFIQFMLAVIADTLIAHASAEKVQQLIGVVGNYSLSAREIMTALGLRNRAYFSKAYLSPAILNGVIEMVNPDSPKSPRQKYRRVAH